jgi:hypothetical protein
MVRETITLLRLWAPGDTTVTLAEKAIMGMHFTQVAATGSGCGAWPKPTRAL